MLFALRGAGRKRTVQIIYLWLALLMGGGLVFFGIGGNSAGGLFDAFKGNGGGGSTDSRLVNQAKRAAAVAAAHPKDPTAWAALTRARFSIAGVGDNYDQQSNTFTSKGLAQLRRAEQAWDHYVGLNPSKPDDHV